MKNITRMNFDDRKMMIQEHSTDYGRAWNTFVAITARLDLSKDDGFGDALQRMAKSEKAKIEFLLDFLLSFYSNTVENIKSKEENYDDTMETNSVRPAKTKRTEARGGQGRSCCPKNRKMKG